MPRRRLLIASATTLPLLFTTASCSSADMFAGPDPLGSAPPLAHDTVVLEAAIAAEQRLIALYKSVLAGSRTQRGGDGTVLSSLLAQHQRHLAELKSRLVIPPGVSAPASGSPTSGPSASGPSASGPSASGPSPGAGGASPITQLRVAERASAATLVRQLATVEPALAQLFASIAASDATHVTALASVGG